eukprot:2381549-Pyramimonas_sp.AAC.1
MGPSKLSWSATPAASSQAPRQATGRDGSGPFSAAPQRLAHRRRPERAAGRAGSGRKARVEEKEKEEEEETSVGKEEEDCAT